MSKKQKTIMVSQAADDFAEGVVAIAVTSIREFRDNGGWNMADDVPAVALKAFQELPKMASNFGSLGAEAKEDAYAFGLAWAAAGQAVYDELVKSDFPEVPKKVAKKVVKKAPSA